MCSRWPGRREELIEDQLRLLAADPAGSRRSDRRADHLGREATSAAGRQVEDALRQALDL